MIPRLTGTPVPLPLYAEFLTELRARGFEGDLSPAYGERTVLATDNSIYQLWPQAIAFPAKHGRPRPHRTPDRGSALRRREARPARRRHRHQRAVADRRPGRGRVPAHEPDSGDQRRGGLGARAGRRGQGPAQCGAGEAWAVLPTGAIDLQPRHDRRDDQHRRERPGLVPLRQDARPRARADHACCSTARSGDRGRSTRGSWPQIQRRTDRVGAIHRLVDAIHRDQAELIASHFPKLNRCLTGYDLAHIRDERRALRPELDPLRRRGHARLRRGGEAERAADPETQRARQRALRQLRRGAARRSGADRVRRGLDRDSGFQGARRSRRTTSSGRTCATSSPTTTASRRPA